MWSDTCGNVNHWDRSKFSCHNNKPREPAEIKLELIVWLLAVIWYLRDLDSKMLFSRPKVV